MFHDIPEPMLRAHGAARGAWTRATARTVRRGSSACGRCRARSAGSWRSSRPARRPGAGSRSAPAPATRRCGWRSPCRETGRRVTTFEVLDAKAALARETFALAGVEDVVEFVHADVRDHLARHGRHLLLLPRLREGGLRRALRGRRAASSCPAACSSPTTPSASRTCCSRCSTARSPTSASTRSSCRSSPASSSAGSASDDVRRGAVGRVPEARRTSRTGDTYSAWHFCDNQADADELASSSSPGASGPRPAPSGPTRPRTSRSRSRRLQRHHGLERRGARVIRTSP